MRLSSKKLSLLVIISVLVISPISLANATSYEEIQILNNPTFNGNTNGWTLWNVYYDSTNDFVFGPSSGGYGKMSQAVDVEVPLYRGIEIVWQSAESNPDFKIELRVDANQNDKIYEISNPDPHPWNPNDWETTTISYLDQVIGDEIWQIDVFLENSVFIKSIKMFSLNDKPTVDYISPTAQETVSGTVDIIVSATDGDGIDRVEFYVNQNYLGYDNSASNGDQYSKSWNTQNYGGFTTLTVHVYDNLDILTVVNLYVTVDNGGGGCTFLCPT